MASVLHKELEPDSSQERSPERGPERNRIDPQSIDLAGYIDHALLHPLAGLNEVNQWCNEADRYGFASVLVAPANVRWAAEALHGKAPGVCAVIAFPMGATIASAKYYEACQTLEAGATELAVVLNLSQLTSGQTDAVHRELAEICEAAGDRPVKAILELGLLPESAWEIAVELAVDAGARWLKTHTGWYGSVTIKQVRTLKTLVANRAGIEASGGVKTIDQAIDLIEAGAGRLGTSRAVAWLQR